MLRSPLLLNTQATRGACDGLVRPYGNGALSTCSSLKNSPRQRTASSTVLPSATTRKWNNVLNTIAHYRGPVMARRFDLSADSCFCSFAVSSGPVEFGSVGDSPRRLLTGYRQRFATFPTMLMRSSPCTAFDYY